MSALTLYAQEKTPTEISRFLIGATYSPNYTYARFSGNNENLPKDRFDRNVPKYGFSTGLRASYLITKRFALETGISYSDKGFIMEEMLVQATNRRMYAMVDLEESYRYIDVPLKSNFYILGNRFKLYATAGLSFNFLRSYTTKLVDTESEISKQLQDEYEHEDFSKYMNKFSLAALIGVGAEYQLINHITLRCEPYFTHDLTDSMKKDEYYEQHFYSFGANVGIFYGF